jgi:hypothetical protein
MFCADQHASGNDADLIRTEMTANIPEEVMTNLTSHISVDRVSTGEDVARVVRRLAANASS